MDGIIENLLDICSFIIVGVLTLGHHSCVVLTLTLAEGETDTWSKVSSNHHVDDTPELRLLSDFLASVSFLTIVIHLLKVILSVHLRYSLVEVLFSKVTILVNNHINLVSSC